MPSKQLTSAATSILQWVLNFAVTPNALPVEDIIVATEDACRHLGEEKSASLRSEAAKTVKRAKNPRSNLTSDER